MKIGIASTDWSRTVKDDKGHPVWGGAGWVRMGQYIEGSRHEVVCGTLGVNVGTNLFNVIDWDMRVHEDCDVIVFQRNMYADLVERVPRARANGQIIVNDIDDWFWGLSTKNDAFKATHPKANPGENINHYRKILANSTAVTVSTPYLADRLSAFVTCPIVVIPNVIDLRRFTPRVHTAGTPTVGWVGSTRHRSGDLEILRGVLRGPAEAGEFKLHHSGHLTGAATFAERIGVSPRLVSTLPLVAPSEYPSILTFDIGLAPLADVPFNRAKCIDAETRVIVRSCGLVRAGDLMPGDEVWRHDQWRKVLAVSHEEPTTGLRITTADGRTIELTPEHRMCVDGRWVQAKDLAVGDVLDEDPEPGDHGHWAVKSTFRYHAHAHSLPNGWVDHQTRSAAGNAVEHLVEFSVDKRFAEIAGLFMARGFTRGGSRQYGGENYTGKMNLEIADATAFYAIALLDSFGIPTSVVDAHGATSSIHLDSTALHRAFVSIGLIREKGDGSYTVERRVPDAIWRSPRSVRRAFLRGFLAAHGVSSVRKARVARAEAPEFADVHRLAHSVGMPLRLERRQMLNQRGFFTAYALSDDCTSDPTIVSIEPCLVAPVDIQVEGEEFCLNGFVSHNSWIKAIEYAAAGIPFVATDLNPYRELYDQYGIGRLAKRPKHWIGHIRALLDPDVRAEEAAANRERVAALDLSHGQKVWDDFFDSLR